MRENQRWRVSQKGGGGKGRARRRLYNPNFSFQTFPRPKSKCRSPTRPTADRRRRHHRGERNSVLPASRRLAALSFRAPRWSEQSGAERESMMQNFLKPFPGKLNVRCSIAERGVEAEGEERERDGERERVYAHFSPFDS